MRRWSDPAVALPEWWTRFEDSEVTRPLRATEVAALYRQLRKGREDSKDEPGAADFYYGEMEMRRLGERTERSFGEKIVLSSYWLTSGYGLRAGRAIGALATTVAVLAGLLYLVGLHSRDWSAAMLQALNAALFRAPDATLLTEAGQYLVIPIRILGPVLVALTFLAMRARVKR
jgi:hypothetical protein